MRRLARDRLGYAGVLVLGMLGLLAMLALLLEGEPTRPRASGWAPPLPGRAAGASREGLAPAVGLAALPGVPALPEAAGAGFGAAAEAGAPGPERPPRPTARSVEEARAGEREERVLRLEGRVCDREGDPLAGARVVARLQGGDRDGSRAEGTSDATVCYQLELRARRGVGRREPRAFVRADLAGYVSGRTVVELAELPEESEPLEVDPIVLLPGASLAGHVLDEAGLPVAQATVRIVDLERRGRSVHERETREDGGFACAELAEGVYQVEASAPGLVTARLSAVPVTQGKAGAAELRLLRAGRLEGRVLDAQGQPLAEALVFAYRGQERLAQATADAEGRYACDGLPAGPLLVLARSPDRSQAVSRGADVLAGVSLPLDLRLQAGAVIRGAVRGADGQPAAEVTVEARSLAGEVRRAAKTDADGRFEVGDLYPGRYVLQVPRGRRGQPRVSLELDVSEGGALEQDLVLPPEAAVSGVVRGPDGAPLAGAQVFAILDGDHRGRSGTDGEGRFALPQLPPARYVLYVRTRGDALLAREEVLLLAGQPVAGLELHARPPATLRGRLVGPDGLPAPGVALVVQGRGAPVERRARTDAEGAFELGPLYDGDYALTASEESLLLEAHRRGAARAALEPEAVPFTVRGGQSLSVALRLRVEPGDAAPAR